MAGVTIWTADDVISLAAWAAVTVAYGLFWFSLAVVVNVFGRTSSVNALVLLGAWLLLVVLGPSTLDLIVTAMHPTPSRVELMQATRAASNTATARGSQLLAMYFQDHPELMRGAPQGASEFATRSLVVADEVAKAVAPITARFDSELDAQQQLIDRWRWISPALVTHVALVDVAGTGTRRYRDFQRQSDAYITVLRAFYEPRITRGARLTRQDIGAIPSFTFDERTLGPATERAWWAATVLAIVAIVITVTALSFARTTAQNSTR
jgi:ABC-2 type transport system permease protein